MNAPRFLYTRFLLATLASALGQWQWRTGVGLFALLAWPALALGESGPLRSGRLPIDLTALDHEMVNLPSPPSWPPSGAASEWTIEDIKAEFAKVTDTPPQVNFVRTRFLLPPQPWLLDFKRWFRALEKPLRLHFEDALWDCDNYANCFVAFADLLALRSGEARAPLCIGWAMVEYQRPFAGVKSGAHAVVIAGSREGLFVIEPQDGTIVALRAFPNRHTIEQVFF